MHHFVTEMCTHVNISVPEWCVAEYKTGTLWDIGSWSIVHTVCALSFFFRDGTQFFQDCLWHWDNYAYAIDWVFIWYWSAQFSFKSAVRMLLKMMPRRYKNITGAIKGGFPSRCAISVPRHFHRWLSTYHRTLLLYMCISNVVPNSTENRKHGFFFRFDFVSEVANREIYLGFILLYWK